MQDRRKGDIWNDSYDSTSTIVSVGGINKWGNLVIALFYMFYL